MKLRTILLASVAVFLALTAWSFTNQITAQDDASQSSGEAEENQTHRRLPTYYGDLVTPGQREKIYGIQDKYQERIEELERQLQEVIAERDAEIESVLEPEQRELLTVIRDQARLLREARAKAAARLKETLPEEGENEASE